jgi:hypothetical protein
VLAPGDRLTIVLDKAEAEEKAEEDLPTNEVCHACRYRDVNAEEEPCHGCRRILALRLKHATDRFLDGSLIVEEPTCSVCGEPDHSAEWKHGEPAEEATAPLPRGTIAIMFLPRRPAGRG